MLITFTVDFLYWTGFGVCDVKLARNIRRMFVTLLLLIGLLRWVKKSRNIIISFQQAIDYRVKVSDETLFAWLSKHPSTPSPRLRSETATYFIVLVFHTQIGCASEIYIIIQNIYPIPISTTLVLIFHSNKKAESISYAQYACEDGNWIFLLLSKLIGNKYLKKMCAMKIYNYIILM